MVSLKLVIVSVAFFLGHPVYVFAEHYYLLLISQSFSMPQIKTLGINIKYLVKNVKNIQN